MSGRITDTHTRQVQHQCSTPPWQTGSSICPGLTSLQDWRRITHCFLHINIKQESKEAHASFIKSRKKISLKIISLYRYAGKCVLRLILPKGHNGARFIAYLFIVIYIKSCHLILNVTKHTHIRTKLGVSAVFFSDTKGHTSRKKSVAKQTGADANHHTYSDLQWAVWHLSSR